MQDSHGNILQIASTPLGKGGEGDTFKVINSSYCVKIFHQGKFDAKKQQKLEYMIKNPIRMDTAAKMLRICWPIDFVIDNGQRVGFIMPLAYDNSHELYDVFLSDYSPDFQRSSVDGMTNRLKLIFNVATAIDILHKSGCVLVDFKPQNILFTDSRQISIIDIDSVQIGKYPSSALTPEYAYPKERNNMQQGRMLTTAWDVYSFAIVAYQMLTGVHPFTVSTNVTVNGNDIESTEDLMSNNFFRFGPRENDILASPPPHYYFLKLHERIRNMFVQSLDLNVPQPSMSEWSSALRSVVKNNGTSIKPNEFNEKPKKPIIIFTNEVPKSISVGDSIHFEWVACYCKRVIIQNTDYTVPSIGGSQKNSAYITVPSSGIIDIMMEGKNATIQKSLTIHANNAVPPTYANVCTNCGKKFDTKTEKFCTRCGTKRELK